VKGILVKGGLRVIFLSCLVAVSSVKGLAQQITTITLAVTPNSPLVSDPVTLTAIISPPQATGKVTFYDGTTILGLSSVTNGKATLVTRLLPSGTRAIQARYGGDASFNGSTSSVVRLTVSAKEGFGFTPAIGSPFAVGTNPQFLAVGDFNGDGKPDLIAPSNPSNAGAGVTVLLNNGSGGFSPAAAGPFALGISALAIAVADFDGDGILDLAIPDRLNNNISIWLGDGAGGFRDAGGRFATGGTPWGVAVADFNADGKPDLAVANLGSNSVTVLLGDGAGGFLSPGRTLAVGSQPLGVATGDFNGDGLPDLAVTNSGDNSVSVLLGDGAGGFTQAAGQLPSTALYPAFLVVADFNGDGNQDLAIANSGATSVTVVLGDGHGGFIPAPESPFAVGISPFSLAVGDFNGDGKPDLAVANSLSSNSVTVLLGDGNGGFTQSPQSPFAVGASPYVVVVGDFNGDGRLDLAAANSGDNNVSVLLANLGLRIAESQVGAFVVSQTGVYALTVTNDTAGPVSGDVTLLDVLPPGLTPTNWSAPGWSCQIAGQNVTCTRSDGLGAGQAYPPLNVTVKVDASACPAAPDVVSVLLNHETSETDSHSTSIQGCLTITKSHSGQFIVSLSANYTLTVAPVNGWVTQSGMTVTVIDVLPAGLTAIAGAGPGWSCGINGQHVTCTRSGELTGGLAYPPINLTVQVAVAACPSVINVAEVLLQDSFQAFSNPDSADASGCLVVVPASLDFQNFNTHLSGQTASAKLLSLTVTSSDNNRVSFSAATIASEAFFAFSGYNTCTLAPGQSCQIIVIFFPVCLGEQVDQLAIVTDAGATYQVPLSGFGVPNSVSFGSVPATVFPGEQYTVGLKLDPVPDATCGKNPTTALSFSPPAPDGTNFDVGLDPSTSILQAGTVAGTITLQAQLDGKNITAPDGSGAVALQVPSQPGVIRSVSIDQRTQSSFQVGVTGFSTPRETGPNATTEVCLTFSPASGASVQANGQLCALKEDIEIWYERSTSYPTGSQFQGNITVSFSGDIKAIGGLKVLLHNKEGDSQPYCVDFQSGNKLDQCP